MTEISVDKMTILLATCIKQFGKDNTLVLTDQHMKAPVQISLHPAQDTAILMLLEGQEKLDKYDELKKKMEDPNIEISERDREPDESPE